MSRGQLSRLENAGEWLDTVGDDLTNYGFFAGAALGLYSKSSHNPLYLFAGAITVDLRFDRQRARVPLFDPHRFRGSA